MPSMRKQSACSCQGKNKVSWTSTRIIEFVMNKHKVIAVPDYSCLVEVKTGKATAAVPGSMPKRKDEIVMTLIAAVIIFGL